MTIKLVRDGVPALMLEQGRTLNSVHAVEGVALRGWLLQKLAEEADEAAEALTNAEILAELADVSEVITALLESIGKTRADLEHAMFVKRAQRGGFSRGWVVDFDE